MNRRYTIYKHTNKLNDKSYIGCTGLNPLHRWGLNGSGYDENNHFGKAIKEYGWDNFSHEILAYGIADKVSAYDLEIKYIKQFNTMFPNGYNTEDGGVHGSKSPHSLRSKRRVKRSKTGWKHTEETKKKMSASIKKSDTHPLHQRINKSKAVDMFNLDSEYIKTFYGASEASRETGIDMSTICKCCKNPARFKSCGGHKWKYHNDINN